MKTIAFVFNKVQMMSLYELCKKLIFLVLIVSILIPLRYRSTNPQYLLIRLIHSTLSLKYALISDPLRPTLSADYRAFENMLRLVPVTDYDPLGDPVTVAKKIRAASSLSNVVPKPSHCQVTKEIFDHDGHTVDTYWVDDTIKNLRGHTDKLIVFMHGGGYVLGDVHSYSGIECHLSELFNVTILHLEYRLGPEHPFPAAVDDTIAVYRTLLQHNLSPSQLIFMGDSAGGGLALLTIQVLLKQQISIPCGVIVISPWTDLSTSSDSYTRNKDIDPMLHIDRARWAAFQLLGPNRSESSLSDPQFSPLFGSFQGFPSMYVTVGTTELIEDDSREVVRKAREAGVNVTFEEGVHLVHVYPIFFPYFSEARHTLENINQWIQTIFIEKTNKPIETSSLLHWDE